MKENQPQNFSEYFALQFKRLAQWVRPDPSDHLLVSIIKTFFKSIAVLLLLIISPVLILGLGLAFFGPV